MLIFSKKPLSLILLVLCSFGTAQFAGAEIRDSICIIKPQIPESTKKLNRDVSAIFRRSGNGDLSEQFEKEAEAEFFGSGFLIKANDGSVWVITNRHVVGNASFAQLTFEKADGTVNKIENCPISIVDDRLDLAFIELPAGIPVPGVTLSLAAAVPVDGTDVWSAGYPGLIGKPSWQLGRGTISNRNLIVEELGPKEDAVYVQHTAPIDPGNSGGPLLIGDIKNPSDMKVIGVNTWSAVGRSNTFFSVSVVKITEALVRAVEFRNRRALESDKRAVAEKATLSDKAKKLEDFVNAKDFDQFAYQGLISNAMSIDSGFKTMFEKLRRMAVKERSEWLSVMVNRSALEGIRKYDSNRIWTKYHTEAADFKFVAVDEPNTIGTGTQLVSFTSGKNTIHLVWALESGNWRIRALDKADIKPGDPEKDAAKPAKTDKEKAADENSEDQFNYNSSGVEIGLGITLHDANAYDDKIGFAGHVSLDLATNPFLAFTVGLSVYNINPPLDVINHYHGFSSNETLNATFYTVSFGFGLKAQLPINIGEGYIMPFVQGGFGISIPIGMTNTVSTYYSYSPFDGFNMDLMLSFGAGLEFSFNKKLAMGLVVNYIDNVMLSTHGKFDQAIPISFYLKPLFDL